MATEGVTLEFTDEAIEEIANHAARFNVEIEDIGARRLHTILEKLLEEISYNADSGPKKINIDKNFVNTQLASLVKNMDLAKFIL